MRLQLPWEDVEIHAKGDFEDRRNGPAHSAWDKYDFLFGEMHRLGLEPIVRIDRPPDWARAQAKETPEFKARKAVNGNAIGPPDHYADYADFVGAVAARYREQVRFIQIWNEPNLSDEWNGQSPSPAQFIELLKLAAAGARAANPGAVILFPSLAPTDGLDLTAPLTDLEFLDQVYALGGGPYFDIMSAQAYGLGHVLMIDVGGTTTDVGSVRKEEILSWIEAMALPPQFSYLTAIINPDDLRRAFAVGTARLW